MDNQSQERIDDSIHKILGVYYYHFKDDGMNPELAYQCKTTIDSLISKCIDIVNTYDGVDGFNSIPTKRQMISHVERNACDILAELLFKVRIDYIKRTFDNVYNYEIPDAKAFFADTIRAISVFIRMRYGSLEFKTMSDYINHMAHLQSLPMNEIIAWW